MLAGRMQHKITIRRRAVVTGNPGGDARGDFVDVFTTRAWMRQENGAKVVEAGLAEDQRRAVLRIYDCARNRNITNADRLILNGVEWSIDSVAEPDKARQMIELICRRTIGG